MYDQSFRNQAVKECVNGQSLRGTASKYGISESALRSWINEYKKRMAIMSHSTEETIESTVKRTEDINNISEDSIVKLRSVNVDIDGYDVTISKQDVVRLMEIFYHFDK